MIFVVYYLLLRSKERGFSFILQTGGFNYGI
ncbi:hypothetical protein [Caudoviricetes sp.]|nr:hypothetical protein [Caudoviricetes sp.]